MPVSLAALPHVAGRLAVAADWAEFLDSAGIVDADAVMSLSGEVVSGHADRHVRRVSLTGDDGERVFYLKREHTAALRSKFKNWRAGAGWVSRCEREARVLNALAARGLPGPRAVAWGYDHAGRAFLLVAELAEFTELRELLAGGRLTRRQRRRLAQRIGESVAALHNAGISTPDLAAKHVYVDDAGEIALLDWQSSRVGKAVSANQALRPLGGLNASLGAELATPRERLLVLGYYMRARGSQDLATSVPLVVAESAKRARRSSVREQHGGESTRLVWLADEAACVVAEFAADWPNPADGPPFYPDTRSGLASRSIRLGGRDISLARFRTLAPIGRCVARLRERPWRSPGAEVGRVLVQMTRHGIPCPTLVGFGQKLGGWGRANSFVAWLDEPDAVLLGIAFSSATDTQDKLLTSAGVMLRRVHDAGLRLASVSREAIVVRRGTIVGVGNPLALRRAGRIGAKAAGNELQTMLAVNFPNANSYQRGIIEKAYTQGGSA